MAHANDNGVDIWYDVKGSGQPIVLSGGFGLLHNQWDYVRDLLAEHFQVIDWNYRGAGQSDRAWPGGAFTQDTWVDDLNVVLEHLDVEDVVLWGTSTGSPISTRFAAKHPARVKALITYPMFKADAGFRAAFDGFTQVGEKFGYDALACLTSWIGCAEENVFMPRQGQMAQWESQCFQNNFAMGTLAETMRICGTNDFTGDLAKIKVPTMLLIGKSGQLGYDAPGNRALTDEFMEHVPQTQLAVIPQGGGTYCMIEEPEATAKAVIDFVKSL